MFRRDVARDVSKTIGRTQNGRRERDWFSDILLELVNISINFSLKIDNVTEWRLRLRLRIVFLVRLGIVFRVRLRIVFWVGLRVIIWDRLRIICCFRSRIRCWGTARSGTVIKVIIITVCVPESIRSGRPRLPDCG